MFDFEADESFPKTIVSFKQGFLYKYFLFISNKDLTVFLGSRF